MEKRRIVKYGIHEEGINGIKENSGIRESRRKGIMELEKIVE